MTKPTNAAPSVERAPAIAPIRTSQALREILSKNPTVKNFTVERIVDSLGDSRVGPSLLLFSIPGMAPVSGASDFAGLSTTAIAGQMIAGRTEIKLPKFILERSVPRRSLAVAIHAILPFLEKAEKAVKPRLRWACHPAAQRILGVLIFLLALTIAFPILGFSLPHAVSIFIISLGLAEHDGLAILIGVVVGVAALVLLTGRGLSKGALRFGADDCVKNIVKKLGLEWAKWAAAFFKEFCFKWSRLLLLLWDPESSSRRAKSKEARANSARTEQKASAIRRRRQPARASALASR